MDVREFYQKTGGGYEDVIKRLLTEERIVKFLKKFPDDASLDELETALKSRNVKAAFDAAHSLRGVTANLAIVDLNKIASNMTELLRNGNDYEGAKEYFPEVEEKYLETIRLIEKL